jgi:positive regulator of sigma E activity
VEIDKLSVALFRWFFDHDLVKKGFCSTIADHDLVKKIKTIMDAEVSTHKFVTMMIEESVCFMSCELIYFLQLFLHTEYIFIFFINCGFFFIKYFHLICHLILTKINCIALTIRSKADFKRKSQNIWQQIILSSRTIMQRICALPKIADHDLVKKI